MKEPRQNSSRRLAGGSEKPGGSCQERRAHIFNMDICSGTRSTRQWALMGFCNFSHFALKGQAMGYSGRSAKTLNSL
jgi:hypothetical protein